MFNMRLKILISLLFSIFVIALLFFYWLLPFNNFEFVSKNSNTNFTITENNSMQFYPNLRYANKEISYRIYNCPLQKENDMNQAFNIISDRTILTFNSVFENEEITVTCDDREITMEGEPGLFIAGEGGPINITKTDLFNVIFNGKILLIKESSCQNSNIAVHELLHALGFGHSDNKQNIMYPISNCNQEIGEDMISIINNLYSFESNPDLALFNASARINGRYLDFDVNIINQGLKKSEPTSISVYVDDNFVKNFDLVQLDIGTGLKITLTNVWIQDSNPEEIKFIVNSNFEELNKENNQLILELKKGVY